MSSIINQIQQALDVGRNYSHEYNMQTENCEELLGELRNALDEMHEQKLRNLADEYFKLIGLSEFESFEKGFKTAVKLLFQALI